MPSTDPWSTLAAEGEGIFSPCTTRLCFRRLGPGGGGVAETIGIEIGNEMLPIVPQPRHGTPMIILYTLYMDYTNRLRMSLGLLNFYILDFMG